MNAIRNLAAGLAVTLSLGAAAQAQDVLTRDSVIAKVGATEITLGQMIVMQETLPQQYRDLADDVLFQAMLDQLIQQAAIIEGLGDLSYRDEIRMENQRRAFLGNIGLDRAAADAVTEENIRSVYDAIYGENYEGELQYKASHILVNTEEEAKALLDDLDGGADFAELAKEKSQGPSGPNGGDLGWFGRGMMVQPFDEAVAAMEKGEIAGPVQTEFGWHVILLADTRTEPAPSFDEAAESIAADLEQEAIEKFLMSATETLEVTLTEIEIDPAVIRNTDLVE